MSKKKKNYRSPELQGYSLSRETYATSSGRNEGGGSIGTAPED